MYTLFDAIQLIIYIFSIFIFVIIYKFFKETFASDDDRFNIFKTVTIALLMLSPMLMFIPNSESEIFEPIVFSETKLDYLNIANKYNIYNNSIYDTSDLFYNITYRDLAKDEPYVYYELGNKNYSQLNSYLELNNFEKLTHTLYFDNSTYYNTLNILCSMIYNFTNIDKVKIHYYYDDGTENKTKNINIVYSDYINTEIDNVTYPYHYSNTYPTGTEKTSSNQMTGHSLRNNGESVYDYGIFSYNYYGGYSKDFTNEYTLLQNGHSKDTLGNVMVKNITLKDSKLISLNKWDTLTLSSDLIINDDIPYEKNDFINIGFEKKTYSDLLIIDKIEISLIKNTEMVSNPFTEYYEFKNMTIDGNSYPVFKFNAVSNNYTDMSTSSFSMKVLGSTLYFTVTVNDVDYVTSKIMINHVGFLGYQIHIFIDEDGYIYIYLYIKWNLNSNTEDFGLYYRFTKYEIQIKDRKYKYLDNLAYYDDSGSNDYVIGYGGQSLKYDIIDRDITKIDYDEVSNVTLIKDVDSGGSRIPSISDIRHAITKALKPITKVLKDISADILKPLNDMLLKIDIIDTAINTINGLVGDLTQKIITEFEKISVIITDELGDLGIDITESLTFIKDAVDSVTESIESVLSAINSIIDQIQSLYLSIVGEGGLIEIINSIVGLIGNFFTSMIDLINYMISYLTEWVQIMFDYTGVAFEYMTNILPIIPEIIGISFSLFAFMFVYGLLSKILIYRNSGDMNHLNAVVDYFHFVISWVYEKLIMVVNWITNIIP